MDPSTQQPFPIAVLVSGTGTNLQALLDRLHGREVEVVAVASNVPNVPALERAIKVGVPTKVFQRDNYSTRQRRDEAMAAWLNKQGARLIVLAGFMEILSEKFLNRFPGSIINIHPSYLPDYPGLRPIERALADGATRFGVTVHLVDAGVDTGPIILQKRRRIDGTRDPSQVLKALRPLEHKLLSDAVRKMVADRLEADAEVARVSRPSRVASKKRAAKRPLVATPA